MNIAPNTGGRGNCISAASYVSGTAECMVPRGTGQRRDERGGWGLSSINNNVKTTLFQHKIGTCNGSLPSRFVLSARVRTSNVQKYGCQTTMLTLLKYIVLRPSMMLVQCFIDRGLRARRMASLAVCLPGDTKLDCPPPP